MKQFSSKIFSFLICASLLVVSVTSVHAASVTTTVDNTGDVGYNSSLALNSNGFPVVSYYDSTSQNLKVAICSDAACNSSTLAIVDSGVRVHGTSLALTNNNFPVISYEDFNSHSLKLAVCQDMTCTTKTIVTVDVQGGLGNSLFLDSNGFPMISYYNQLNHDLRLVVCQDVLCATKVITTVDSTGELDGGNTSMRINGSGFPVISYFDQAKGDLKLAVCANLTCTSRTITQADSAGFVGGSISLALKNNDYPSISYFDFNNSALKLASCFNATCTNKTITIVDNSGYVGWDTSLALNGNDFPTISYYDSTRGNLNLAVCHDTTCANKTIVSVDQAGGSGVGGIGSFTSSLKLNTGGIPIISYFHLNSSALKLATVDITTIPIVISTTLLTNYKDKGPQTFNVIFSEDVNDPAGNTNNDDVTNPANYLIVEVGANGEVDTISCAGGVKDDDVKIPVSSVEYTNLTAKVTLTSPLTIGNYQLFVCGTTSIVNLVLTALGNGLDYFFDFNVLASSIPTTQTQSSLPDTGFTPSHITFLPRQLDTFAYANIGNILLEIPSLNVKTEIVGVPQISNSWNIDWLGNNAGWLNGTAFPTWEGNSVLTGHVYNADGLPGPFVNLKDLKYGDQVIVHMYGEKYVFEVRGSSMIFPSDTKFALEHLEGHSYLTLITCQGYNSVTDSYTFRRVVRAVLVDVESE